MKREEFRDYFIRYEVARKLEAEKLAKINEINELIKRYDDKPEGDVETVLSLIDFYIKHYEKLGKKGLAGAMRELQTDINNALGIGNAKE